jgi:hypothetical protein
MASTLGSLRTKVLTWLDETENTTETFENVTNAINMAHQQRCTEQPWSFMLWRQLETFALVAGTRRYALHPQVNKMLYVYNKTKKQYLVETPWREVQISGVRWTDDTSGERYIFVEPSPVLTQPTVASTLTLTSSSSGDSGTSYNVQVTGMVDSVIVTETITPAGLTGVSTTSVFDAGSLIAVSKISDWAGTLTLKAGATTLLTLRPSERSRSYPQIELLWTPGDADTIEYRFYRKPRTLVEISDVPDLPDEFADLLVWDALILMAAYDGDITASRLNAWTDQRDKVVTAIGQTYLEGSTVAAEPRFIRDLTYDQDEW